MKFLDYSIEKLNTQHMVILLPLYLLKLRQQIEKAIKQEKNRDAMRQNAQALKDLINNGILKNIYENEKAGNIDGYDVYVLVGLVKKLYEHLYEGIKEFEEEGVKSMLNEKLLVEYEDRLAEEAKILAENMAQNMAENMAQNMAQNMAENMAQNMAENMAQNKILKAAKNLLAKGLSTEDVAEAMELPVDIVRNLPFQKISVG